VLIKNTISEMKHIKVKSIGGHGGGEGDYIAKRGHALQQQQYSEFKIQEGAKITN
jgi:hypothetical protein